MLVRELRRYSRLKEQISFRKTGRVREKTVEGVDKTSTVIEQQQAASPIEGGSGAPDKTAEEFKGPVDMIEAFAGALEELKQFIHGEFRALREELKEWRKT